MNRLARMSISLLLSTVMCLMCAVPALADDTAQTDDAVVTTETTDEIDMTIFDSDELQSMVESFIEEYKSYGVKPERFSIAYTYLATGETWYYNADTWLYSASMYKVPLMMILAQKEADGELTQESNLKGITLAKAENSILVYSNNDYAHLMLSYLGTDQEAREMYKQFSSLPDDYYDSDFVDYSYFTARFMDDVMNTLYSNPERFPHIIDCLKQAQPEDWFHLYTDDDLVIAQKYGSYNEFNSTTGIIYTPNPVILTVMTKNVESAEKVIGSAAKMFVDYTLTLDDKLESYQQEKADAIKLAEEEAKAAQEAEEERIAQEEAEKAAQEQAQQEELARQQEEAEKAAARSALIKKLLICAGSAAVIGIAIGVIAAKLKGKSGKKSAHRSDRDYTPRH